PYGKIQRGCFGRAANGRPYRRVENNVASNARRCGRVSIPMFSNGNLKTPTFSTFNFQFSITKRALSSAGAQ
ncbi:MAG: hypothetical protein IKQ04_09990, partial [Oscillospiraceae bacterium]|nr:hypothetical protein [Oscillospiraceae bacterium]